MPTEVGGKAVVMRELAKSMLGFSWAVGLFGVQQLGRALAPASPPDVTAAELDDVAYAAQRHLSDPYAERFRAGDEWQRRVVDVFFDAMTLRSLDPRAVASTLDPRPLMIGVAPRDVLQSGVDLLQRSVDLVRPASPPSTTPTAV